MKTWIFFGFTVSSLFVCATYSFAQENIIWNLDAIREASKIVGTYGLSVFLVLYYVLFLRRKELGRYEDLGKSYTTLNETYQQLRADLKPETRLTSVAQTRAIGELGLDRDYFKLYRRMKELCEKCVEGDSSQIETQIENYMNESILDTIRCWGEFVTPIGDLKELFEDSRTEGKVLSKQLSDMVKSDKKLHEKLSEIDALLLKRALDSKKILHDKLTESPQPV